MSSDDDHLTQLLRRADDAAQQPPRVSGLATRVLKRRARRRHMRIGAASVAALLVFAVLAWQFIDGRPAQERPIALGEPARTEPARPEPITVAAVQDTLDRLAHECERREAAVARMLSAQRRRTSASHAAADPALELAWQREQAALVLVRQGDRLSQDLDLPRSAAAAYRQARDTFPGTR